MVERDGTLVEVRDRRGRRKTREVVLVRDRAHPVTAVTDADRAFALGAARRRWSTVVKRYGERSFDVAVALVCAGVVELACRVDARGMLGVPTWWAPTDDAARTVESDRARDTEAAARRDAARDSLANEVEPSFPEVATALRRARTQAALAVLTASARDLLAGIEHAGPRAFTQVHFGDTKALDVRAVLTTAGVPATVLERLGLRRGDRVGLGGPIVVTTEEGSLGLAPLRGPVVVRLDQPGLAISTEAATVVVIENLQPAEVVCARYPDLPVVYTAGQFGDDAAELLGQLASQRKSIIAIVDADLGGVRIARRVLAAAPSAQVVDVGSWPHPPREPFPAAGAVVEQLRTLAEDPAIAWFAAAVLARGYPVEQELATLDVVGRFLLDEAPERPS